jgi:hypothetical protein
LNIAPTAAQPSKWCAAVVGAREWTNAVAADAVGEIADIAAVHASTAVRAVARLTRLEAARKVMRTISP